MTRREFEVTDPVEILKILDNCKYLHLGLIDDGMPYVLPMNYGYTMEDGKLTIYLHSGKKGYKMGVIPKNPNCCFTMEYDVVPFEAEVACRHGVYYRCLMGRGKISIIEDVEEKKKALTSLMKVQTGKDFEFTDRMTEIVACMRIDVDEYTAKVRPDMKEMESKRREEAAKKEGQ